MNLNRINSFLIRLLSFEIRQRKSKNNIDNFSTNEAIYDLSHENPFLSIEFSNEIKQLEQEALTEMFALPKEQVQMQVLRLQLLNEEFNTFWKKYYTYTTSSMITPAEEWANLHLADIFIVNGIDKITMPEVRQQFIDDVTDSVQSRQQALEKFTQKIQDVLSSAQDVLQHSDPESLLEISKSADGNQEVRAAFSEDDRNEKPFNFSSEEVKTSFYNILQSRFSDQDKNSLLQLFEGNHSEDLNKNLLIFNGNGNQLADAFKQLFEGNLIVGCSKQILQNWIAGHFLYKDGNRPKPYNEKYLSDIISSTTRECQSPILEVKKDTSGTYQVLPTYRTMKNYKK